jgi:hypothetical protein
MYGIHPLPFRGGVFCLLFYNSNWLKNCGLLIENIIKTKHKFIDMIDTLWMDKVLKYPARYKGAWKALVISLPR